MGEDSIGMSSSFDPTCWPHFLPTYLSYLMEAPKRFGWAIFFFQQMYSTSHPMGLVYLTVPVPVPVP